ncbi:hypothetical protein [Nostoc sp. 'Peltigera membranacea cyanobiont' 232]|uniref:hypothetical protein n=1 Tax=Nostoc sp. 'Peltigera membranacea cyanobiont' 232 TaxID=2014531 RepID=UPI001180C652|nr:hypothetical protein [Nostoc sp. 'Peltigera membranacea cyanobiont' 232]
MGTLLTIGVPLTILLLKEMIDSRKHRQELAKQQERRDEAMAYDIGSLKANSQKNSGVLDDIQHDISEVRERLVRVETKISI